MKKTIVFEIAPEKETKGCFRYMRTAGDEGVRTIYLNKCDLDGRKPPQRVTMTLEGTD